MNNNEDNRIPEEDIEEDVGEEYVFSNDEPTEHVVDDEEEEDLDDLVESKLEFVFNNFLDC